MNNSHSRYGRRGYERREAKPTEDMAYVVRFGEPMTIKCETKAYFKRKNYNPNYGRERYQRDREHRGGRGRGGGYRDRERRHWHNSGRHQDRWDNSNRR